MKMMWLLLLGLALTLGGCVTGLPDGAGDNLLQAPGISRTLARQRRELIRELSYDLDLDIDPSAETFHGICELNLLLSHRPLDDLLIDFDGRRVDGLKVNGRTVPVRQVANHILVAGGMLKEGANRITINYVSGMGAAGEGIIKVSDKDDGSTYLYTLNVPADGHKVFPCFDQPDLKARFRLRITLPFREESPNKVISNAPLEKVEDLAGVNGPKKRHTFRSTKAISTYLFAFAVGPFHSISSESEGRTMRFFGRQSQKALLEKHGAEIFRLHRESLKFLESWFDWDYPFAKFEFVCVPDFPFSGMEHPGCIFYGEDPMLFRGPVSKLRELRRADLIAHETAHMWFGDLVTMPWFDDVWLKEGYATFMAHKTLEAIFSGMDHDAAFFLRLYPSALATDVTEGSTPMRQPLGNMADAKSNYGPIIYRKGPAVLRALEYMVGPATFQAGARLLLKRHAFATASWQDLRRALEDAWGRGQGSLLEFGRAWIEEAGVPRVVATFAKERDAIVVRQDAPHDPDRLWPLTVEVCWISGDGTLERRRLPVDSKEAVLENVGPHGDFLFANDNNRAYGRFVLAPSARRFVMNHFSSFDDLLLRSMLWEALWSAVQDEELSPIDYLDFALEHVSAEKDQRLLSLVLSRVHVATSRYLTGQVQRDFGRRLDHLLLDTVKGSAHDEGTRLVLLRRFIGMARSTEGLDTLAALVAGEPTPGGLEVSRRDRWNALARLMLLGDKRADELLDLMTAIEEGDEARRRIFMVECARGTAESKRRIFDRFFSDPNLPERWVQDGAGVFFSSEQAALTLEFLDEALDRLEWIKANRRIFFLAAWLDACVGSRLTPEAVEIVEDHLNRRLPRDIRNKLLVPFHHLKRTVAVR